MSQNCEGEKVQNIKATIPLTVEGWTMQDCITMQERGDRGRINKIGYTENGQIKGKYQS